jgi:hypothetical protein
VWVSQKEFPPHVPLEKSTATMPQVPSKSARGFFVARRRVNAIASESCRT